jgi:hypothetical protein
MAYGAVELSVKDGPSSSYVKFKSVEEGKAGDKSYGSLHGRKVVENNGLSRRNKVSLFFGFLGIVGMTYTLYQIFKKTEGNENSIGPVIPAVSIISGLVFICCIDKNRAPF